jgi:predicted metal-dependent HD superfamily phosphohydrolase
MSLLEAAWMQCFQDMGGSQPPPCIFEELRARYDEPHRAYHTLQHLEECLSWFAQTRPLFRHPGEVAFALFYHDAIYDTHAQDNEKRSAELANDVIGEYVRGNANADQVNGLIMATTHDASPADPDAQLLVDIDLSILGASSARFGEYELQIRKEFDWVDRIAFRDGRRKVLAHFLDRAAIYSTPFFQERLEKQARDNLAHSIELLDAQPN